MWIRPTILILQAKSSYVVSADKLWPAVRHIRRKRRKLVFLRLYAGKRAGKMGRQTGRQNGLAKWANSLLLANRPVTKRISDRKNPANRLKASGKREYAIVKASQESCESLSKPFYTTAKRILACLNTPILFEAPSNENTREFPRRKFSSRTTEILKGEISRFSLRMQSCRPQNLT